MDPVSKEDTPKATADVAAQDDEGDQSHAAEAPGSPSAKKKRKPKKKAKKLVAPPSLVAAEGRLPWSLAFTQRLGRHAVAKRDIAAGELVLLEAPVATVVRSQYVRDVCHVCFKDMAAPARAPGPHKRYCSRACAQADAHAPLTQGLHALVEHLSGGVDALLLHILLELDVRRAQSPPPVRAALSPEHGWLPILDRPLAESTTAEETKQGAEEQGDPKTEQPEQQQQQQHNDASTAANGRSGHASAGAEAVPASAANGAGGKPPGSGAAAAGAEQQKQAPEKQASEAGAQHAVGGGAEDGGAKGGRGKGGSGEGKDAARAAAGAGGGKGIEPLTCGLEDVATLAAHWERFPDAWRGSVRAGCEVLRSAILKSGVYSPGSLQQFLDLAAVVNSNSHGAGAANESNTDRALGLYPALSMINHSCAPNCVFTALGMHMQVRANQAIKAGEQLTVAYVGVLEPRRVRAQELLESKHFVCACARCSQPLAESVDLRLEAQKCGEPGCKGWLLEQRKDALSEGAAWACTACAASVPSRSLDGAGGPADRADALRRAWQQALQAVRAKGHAAARPMFEALLAEAEATLHPQHVVIIDSFMPLVNCCRAAGDTLGAIKHLTQLLAAMDAICGGVPTVEVGNLNELLGHLLSERANSAPPGLQARAKKQTREARLRALSLYQTCLGTSHEKYTDLASRLRMTR